MAAKQYDDPPQQDRPGKAADAPSSLFSSAFRHLGTIPLFTYLTATKDKVDYYRTIMRFLLARNREYEEEVTLQEIYTFVKQTFDASYTLDICRQDLESLIAWGNISVFYDEDRFTSIEALRYSTATYRATVDALAVETFIEQQEQRGASQGGLRTEHLPHILQALERIHVIFKDQYYLLTQEERQEVAIRWREAYTTWKQMADEASRYVASINASLHQTVNPDLFLHYKNIVVSYVRSFAHLLSQHSGAIRTRLTTWELEERYETLAECIAAYPDPPTLAQETTLEERQTEAYEQIKKMCTWFARGRTVDTFRKRAIDAVRNVVQQADVIAAMRQQRTDYSTLLHALASQLLTTTEMRHAQLLFATAFAHSVPQHLSRGQMGIPVADDVSIEHDVWKAPPTVARTLHPIRRGNMERGEEEPMHIHNKMHMHIREQHLTEQSKRRALFTSLFQDSLLDLGTLQQVTPQLRRFITAMASGCLSHPAQQYRAPDGSLIELLNPQEHHYILLRAPDGILALPRYRFRRTAPPAQYSF
jgi:uncharacterized protein (TIGR02677 family)